jgi:hypothetical protein
MSEQAQSSAGLLHDGARRGGAAQPVAHLARGAAAAQRVGGAARHARGGRVALQRLGVVGGLDARVVQRAGHARALEPLAQHARVLAAAACAGRSSAMLHVMMHTSQYSRYSMQQVPSEQSQRQLTAVLAVLSRASWLQHSAKCAAY